MTGLKAPLEVEDIKKLLPHRYPFLLVDRVLSLESPREGGGMTLGRKLVARKNVSAGEPFFQGHFPQKALMPGVLILESIAQAGALCCSALPGDPPLKEVFFVGADQVRFKRPVIPGDTLEIKVEMVKQKPPFYWGQGMVYVESELAARALILARILFDPPPQTG